MTAEAPHVLRLRQEQSELGIRLEKLGAFIDVVAIFKQLEPAEQADLLLQRQLMQSYHDTLTRRLARLKLALA